MIIIKFPDFIQYNLIKDKNIFKQQIYECPNCKFEGRLYNHGSYQRNVITEDNSYRITINRVKCPICGKTHALIPDFLIPYFQHSFYTVKKCLELKFLERYSYKNIIDYFEQRNINSYISAPAISIFVNRFISITSNIRLFFNTYTEIYSNESTSERELLTFINAYNSNSNSQFNLNYFKNMPTFFMCKT